ncbi:unnamed protein product [Pseudo-nitzschia multistriata]|uniref:Uncharacterized protein n=1 Tax=Pseudo-nitzschia multistriata TaxID=183589 RepID=A0A448Z3K9_9STRA|nr:unnamed protein product [Pseudo-nitzschia multistriata]
MQFNAIQSNAIQSNGMQSNTPPTRPGVPTPAETRCLLSFCGGLWMVVVLCSAMPPVGRLLARSLRQSPAPFGGVLSCPVLSRPLLCLLPVVHRPAAPDAADHRLLVEEDPAVVPLRFRRPGVGRGHRPVGPPGGLAPGRATLRGRGKGPLPGGARFRVRVNAGVKARVRSRFPRRRVELGVEVLHGAHADLVLLLDVVLVLDLLVAVDGADPAVLEEGVVDGRGGPDDRGQEALPLYHRPPGPGGHVPGGLPARVRVRFVHHGGWNADVCRNGCRNGCMNGCGKAKPNALPAMAVALSVVTGIPVVGLFWSGIFSGGDSVRCGTLRSFF